jgi:hypothetical protein
MGGMSKIPPGHIVILEGSDLSPEVIEMAKRLKEAGMREIDGGKGISFNYPSQCELPTCHRLGCIGHCDPALIGAPEPYNESDTLP